MYLSENLVYLRDAKVLTQAEFSDTIGVQRASLSHWETGKRVPPFEILLRIARKCNVTLTQLVEQHHNEWGQEYSIASEAESLYSTNRQILCPLPVNAGAAMDSGWAAEGKPVLLPFADNHAVVFEICGDSMTPLINHQDFVVGKKIDDNPVADRPYIVSTKEGILCKYVKYLPDGGVELISLNKEVAGNITLTKKELEHSKFYEFTHVIKPFK